MNTTMNLRSKRMSMVIQLLLIALSFLGAIEERFLFAILAFALFQIGSTIWHRITFPMATNRDTYDLILAYIGSFYFLPLLMIILFVDQEWAVVLAMNIAGFMLIPYLIRIWHSKDRNRWMTFILVQVIWLIILVPLTISHNLEVVMFALMLGAWIMLYLGPCVAIHYLFIEWREYRRLSAMADHSPLDL